MSGATPPKNNQTYPADPPTGQTSPSTQVPGLGVTATPAATSSPVPATPVTPTPAPIAPATPVTDEPAPTSSVNPANPTTPGIPALPRDTPIKTARDTSKLAKLRAAIELPVLRRVSSSLDGRHRTIASGRGQDFSDLVDYAPGDSVSDIDWKTSARNGSPVIKRFQREASLSLILLVDTGRSMGALAPSGQTKEEVALHAAEILAYLALMRGDSVGLIAGDSVRLRQIPARNGNSHLETILRYLEQDISLTAPPSDVTRLLHRLFVSTRRRSLIILITDEVNPPPQADQILRRIRTRHELMVISVVDANPTDLEYGAVAVDVDQGPLPDFVLIDKSLRQQAHQVAYERRRVTKQMLKRRGVQYVSVPSTDDVIPALIDILGRHKRAYT